SGLATIVRVDFKGAAEEITRTLVDDVEAPIVDWSLADRGTLLKQEMFIQITEHDALGRMIRHYNWHRDTPGQPGHNSRVAVYVPKYNERGVLESETLHVQAVKRPGANGRASFDPHADTKKNVQAIKRITWNAKGQKLSLELGNGTTTRYTYDSETFRLTQLYTRRDMRFGSDCAGDPDASRPARPCGVQNLHYTYDPVGNITHIQDDAQQTVWFANQQVEPSNDYIYDALYRLIEATGRENSAAVGAPPHREGPWSTGSIPSPDATRNYTQRYGYDSVGNVITMQHIAANFPGEPDGSWTRDYAYAFDDPAQPASNRLWQTWESGDRTKAVTYRHDPHGNMLNLAKTEPGLDIRWDWRDMIRALDLQGGGDAFYNYGIDKQRTRKCLKRNGSGIEDRIYLGGYELYRRTVSGAVVEEIESLHLFEGEQRVLLVDDVIVAAPQVGQNGLKVKEQTLFRYQYGNHLGSISLELDENAQVISYEEFHPYGTSAYRLMNSATEAPAKRYRYTGMERDEESGLCYHGARYYAPWLGRWIGCDSVMNTNLFFYANNNPVVLMDLNGRSPKVSFFDSFAALLRYDTSQIADPNKQSEAAVYRQQLEVNYEKANDQKLEEVAEKASASPSWWDRFKNTVKEKASGALDWASETKGGKAVSEADESLKRTAGSVGAETLDSAFGGIQRGSQERLGSSISYYETPAHLGREVTELGYEGLRNNVVAGAIGKTAQVVSGTVTQLAGKRVKSWTANVLVGVSREQFRRNAEKIIRDAVKSGKGHPLERLLDKTGKFFNQTAKGTTSEHWWNDPRFVEAGHVVSMKSGESEKLILMTAEKNRKIAATIEHPDIGGHMALPSEALDIGGIAVDVDLANDLVNAGYLDAQVVQSATLIHF
ncbi:MAG: RHS repeat-associated core domain-containing protein, partial [Planctomycetota bacterium]